MGSVNRLAGYLASAACASIFYVAWFVVSLELTRPRSVGASVLFYIGFAIFFLLFGGMGAALVLMAVPWSLAVWGYGRLHCFGPIYFSLIGAASALVIACGTSSLSPKPFFIEDQTFLEGFTIAAERQGICFLLTGLVFGVTFWLVSERSRDSRSIIVS